jgi:hypothetical protein
MVGLLFLALLVGPTAAVLFWNDGVGIALVAAAISASAIVLGAALITAYHRPVQRHLRLLHERGVAQGHFGPAWRASAHA